MQQLTLDKLSQASRWTIHEVEHPRLGQYLAEYHRPIPEDADPHLTPAGVHIKLEQFRGGQVQFQGYASTGVMWSPAMHDTRNLPDFTAAMAYAEQWLTQAEHYVKNGPPIQDRVSWVDELGVHRTGEVRSFRDLQTALILLRHPSTTYVMPVAALRPANEEVR